MKPASAACSRPPTAASTPTGSAGSGWWRASAARTTLTFLAHIASSMPVPRPVTSSGSAPVNTATSAADAVVLAMPMSPVSRQRLPAATRSRAISMPTSTALAASSRLMAGPVVMSAVPARTLRDSSPGPGGRSVATPTSTTQTPAPVCAAMALTTAPEAMKFATICAVTSCGQGVTPWAWTPWSAANTAITAGSGNGGGHSPASPASCAEISSSIPSEPLGLVSRSWRSRASATAEARNGVTAATVSSSRLIESPPSKRAASCRARSPGWVSTGGEAERGIQVGRVVEAADGPALAMHDQAGDGSVISADEGEPPGPAGQRQHLADDAAMDEDGELLIGVRNSQTVYRGMDSAGELLSRLGSRDHVPTFLAPHPLGDRVILGNHLAEQAGLPDAEPDLPQPRLHPRGEAEPLGQRCCGLIRAAQARGVDRVDVPGG